MQKLQQQMIAMVEKANKLKAEHNFLAATYAEDELEALTRKFLELENSPLIPSSVNTNLKTNLPTSVVSVMHRSGRDKRTKRMQNALPTAMALGGGIEKKIAMPPKLQI